MNMSKSKKIVFVILVLTALLLLILPQGKSIYAIVYDNSLYPYIEEYANRYVKLNYDDETIIKNIVPIYDLNESVYAYCINFSINEEPNGYIILLNGIKDNLSPLIEFNKDKINLFTEGKRVYALSQIQYGEEYKSNQVSLLNGYKKYSKSYLKSNTFIRTQRRPIENSTSIYGGYFNAIPSDKTLKTWYMNADIKLPVIGFTQIHFDVGNYSDGICCATTTINILKYYKDNLGYSIFREKNGKPDDQLTYDCLRTCYDIYLGVDSYNIGGSNVNSISTLKKYISIFQKSFNVSSTTYNNSLSWSNCVGAIKNKFVLYYGMRGIDGGGDIVGHAVMVYTVAETTDGSKYMGILDTWNTSGRTLQYGYHGFNGAYKVKVTKV